MMTRTDRGGSGVRELLALFAAAAVAPAQMEMRSSELYARGAFERQAPALGAVAPDLCLERIDGRPWSLAQQLGRTVVLVKASFT